MARTLKRLTLVFAVAVFTLSVFTGCLPKNPFLRQISDYNGTWACDLLTVTSDIQPPSEITGTLTLEGKTWDLVIRDGLYCQVAFYDKALYREDRSNDGAVIWETRTEVQKNGDLVVEVDRDYLYEKGQTKESLAGQRLTLKKTGDVNKKIVNFADSTATWSGDGMTLESAPGEEYPLVATAFIEGKERTFVMCLPFNNDGTKPYWDFCDKERFSYVRHDGKLVYDPDTVIFRCNVYLLDDDAIKVVIEGDKAYKMGEYDTCHEGKEFLLKLTKGTVTR